MPFTKKTKLMLQKPKCFFPEKVDEIKDPSKRKIANDIRLSSAFQLCPSWRAQVEMLNAQFDDPLKLSKKKISFTDKEIASMFDCKEFSVKNQITKINKQSQGLIKPNGRPFSLTCTMIYKLKEYAKNSEFHRTVFEIKLFISNLLGKTPDHKVFDSALKRIGYRKADAKPMESRRYFLDMLGLYHFFQIIEKYFDENNIPSCFVFNLDEEGHSAQADAKTISVIVPESYNKEVTYPINKEEKRITFLGCISGSGDYLKPLIITSRKTAPLHLLAANVIQKIKLGHSESGFINEKLFMEWFEDVFLVHIRRLRQETHYDGPAVLFLDGATAHAYEKLTEKCAENNIKVFLFPAHSSHLVQPLDLVVFHVHKSYIRRDNVADALDKKFTERILKLFSTWQSAATVVNINSAWEAMGVTFIPCENGATIMRIRMKDNKRIQKAIAAARMTNPELEIPELEDATHRVVNLEALYKSRLSLEAFNQLNGIIVNSELKGIFKKHKLSLLDNENANAAPVSQQEETRAYMRAANEFVNSTPNPLLDPIPSEPGEDYSDSSVPHPIIPPTFMPDSDIVEIPKDGIDVSSIDESLLTPTQTEMNENRSILSSQRINSLNHYALQTINNFNHLASQRSEINNFAKNISLSDLLSKERTTMTQKGAILRERLVMIELVERNFDTEIWKVHDKDFDCIALIELIPMNTEIPPDQRGAIWDRFSAKFKEISGTGYPNVVHYYDYMIVDDDKLVLMKEYYESDAHKLLCHYSHIPEHLAKTLIEGAINGLLQLGVNPQINLCPGHICLLNNEVKITDFRVSELINSCYPLLSTREESNSFYQAPEKFQFGKKDLITSASITYSIGIIFYKFLTGDLPDPFKPREVRCFKISKEAYAFIDLCLDNGVDRPKLEKLITTYQWAHLFN